MYPLTFQLRLLLAHFAPSKLSPTIRQHLTCFVFVFAGVVTPKVTKNGEKSLYLAKN